MWWKHVLTEGPPESGGQTLAAKRNWGWPGRNGLSGWWQSLFLLLPLWYHISPTTQASEGPSSRWPSIQLVSKSCSFYPRNILVQLALSYLGSWLRLQVGPSHWPPGPPSTFLVSVHANPFYTLWQSCVMFLEHSIHDALPVQKLQWYCCPTSQEREQARGQDHPGPECSVTLGKCLNFSEPPLPLL